MSVARVVVTDVVPIIGIYLAAGSLLFGVLTFIFNLGATIRQQAYSVVVRRKDGQIVVRNLGETSIFRVTVRCGDVSSPKDGGDFSVAYIEPGKSSAFLFGTDLIAGTALSKISVKFDDARSLHWQKSADGRLTLLDPSSRRSPAHWLTRSWLTSRPH